MKSITNLGASIVRGDEVPPKYHMFVAEVAQGMYSMGFSDGTATVFATRERPQLVFADAARTTPCGLTNAASSQPLGGMCDSCREGACSQCKTTAGRDWCFTVFQGLETGKYNYI